MIFPLGKFQFLSLESHLRTYCHLKNNLLVPASGHQWFINVEVHLRRLSTNANLIVSLLWKIPGTYVVSLIHSSLRSTPCLPFQSPLLSPALPFGNTSHGYSSTPCLCMGVIPSRKTSLCSQTPSFPGCPALLVCPRLRGFLRYETLNVKIRTVPGEPGQLVILFISPVHVSLGYACIHSGPDSVVEWMGVDVWSRRLGWLSGFWLGWLGHDNGALYWGGRWDRAGRGSGEGLSQRNTWRVHLQTCQVCGVCTIRCSWGRPLWRWLLNAPLWKELGWCHIMKQ